MQRPDLKGKRYVNLLRCSTLDQDTSIDNQRLTNNTFAREHKMIHVFDKEAEGVSGSKTFNRNDITELVQARKNGADFEVVLIHDFSRLTRGGVGHGHDVKQRLARVGVQVVSVGDNVPTGEEAELIESVVHYKNRIYSKNLSAASTTGRFKALKSGKHPYSSATPYGYDRLYTNAHGQPVLLLRYIGGGVRQKIDPITMEVRETLYRNKEGRSQKYCKQRDEISKLVLGIPERVELVRWMFKEHYLNGVGVQKITNHLNVKGITPPTANEWYVHTVFKLLRNAVYLGKPIACRVSSGHFFKTSENRPTPVNVNQAALEEMGAKAVPVTKRNPEEWIVPEPSGGEQHVAIIDDPDVRRIAEPRIEEYWLRWADGTTSESDRDRHRASAFFLKKLLRSRQGDYRMSGRSASHLRYYRIKWADAKYPVGSVFRRQIPAQPVEEAVLCAVEHVLALKPDIGAMVEKHVVAELANLEDRSVQRQQLHKEDKRLQARQNLIIQTVDGETDCAGLMETLSKIKERRREIRSQLGALEAATKREALNPAAIGAAVKAEFRDLHRVLRKLPMIQLRSLVAILCRNLVVDLETRDLEFEVYLPSWAISATEAIRKAVGLVSPLSRQIAHQAHAANALIIEKFVYRYARESSKGGSPYTRLLPIGLTPHKLMR
jgi:DNA invertase Pin-like site-specific DNA recombinase